MLVHVILMNIMKINRNEFMNVLSSFEPAIYKDRPIHPPERDKGFWSDVVYVRDSKVFFVF